MTLQDERIIAAAYERHIAEHDGNFVTCQDAGCRAAQWVRESAQCYPKQYGASLLESVLRVISEIEKITAWFEQKREASR